MNRLGAETSPYLRQHRDNPVDWYPWGDEAFQRAHREDRPILLSVGYSSCHWCHVMAHECFEDETIAALQNRLFVSIKVDREERPDVDRVYMDALQALTGSGGWPMTVFLLPDGRPFFAGTYFPPRDRSGLPGFPRLLESLAAAYHQRRAEVVANADRLSQALRPAPLVAATAAAGLADTLATAESRLVNAADREFGGLGDAPKFPQCAVLEFLLAHSSRPGGDRAGEEVHRALRAMAAGGIHDQLDGGFHRYSVDRRWAVPHFEKMLYDNAQLLRLYLHAWQADADPRDLDVARRTADFLARRMRLSGGGFAASFDADTKEGEGAFYGWTEAQLAEALGPSWRQLVETHFGGPGTAETEEGRRVLRGGSAGGGDEGARGQLVRQLAAARERRPAPDRDDKLIVGWNALAITAFAELAVATGEVGYLEVASEAAAAVLAGASSEGQLGHLFDGERARFAATLDDLAGMGLAALALHEATGEPHWFDLALQLALRAEADYRDPAGPGWFDTPDDHDAHLGIRPRTLEDGSQPAGLSLMTELCLRLAALTGEPSWRDRAEGVLRAMASAMERFPSAFGTLLGAASLLDAGAIELALVTPTGGLGHWPLLRCARARFRPSLVVGVGRVAEGEGEAAAGPLLVRARPLLQGVPTAYVCRDFACRRPVTDGGALERELAVAL